MEQSPTAILISASPDQTRELAAALGRLCRGGEVILLSGDLGSGKTCFTQGLARGLEVPATTRVTSPTFTLHAEYRGRLYLNHLDLYRLDNPLLLEGLGLDEMVCDLQAVTAIEWPEILGTAAGRERLEIQLADRGNDSREIIPVAHGVRHDELLARWLQCLRP